MKKCTKCGETKPLDDFVKDSRISSGHKSQCKMCVNKLAIQNQRTRRARLGSIKICSKVCSSCRCDLPLSDYNSQKSSRDDLQSVCKSCAKSHRQKKLAENPDHYYGLHLKKTYGMSLEEFHEMEKSQNYKCKICGTTDPGTYKGKGVLRNHFAVDHDHDTGKVRGLLCRGCNIGIGMLDDDLKRIEAAAVYLRKHKHA